MMITTIIATIIILMCIVIMSMGVIITKKKCQDLVEIQKIHAPALFLNELNVIKNLVHSKI